MKLLSVGMNQKLGKEIGVFNLPQALTCPGKSDACKICYANKAERVYKTVRNKRMQNLMFIETQGTEAFADAMIKEIKERKLKKVRLHESGDFYTQSYINAWVKIIKACPDVKFLAYTKSYRKKGKHFNFSELKALPNLSLFASTDYDAKIEEAPEDLPKAHLVLRGETPPKGYITCMSGDLEEHYCGTRCQICWNAKQNGKIKGVYFDQH